ncbi:MAG: hypothetical protein IT362_04370 [Deltaproteobacteria bacterium]|nr:hypothetical protein [Deltaproteobacteria bacterium]
MTEVLNISNFTELLPKSSTRPFIAFSDSNQKFVIKALLNSTSRKRIVSEYLIGALAEKIGLCRPKAYLATLTEATIKKLSNASIKVITPDCVALEFVEGLTEVPSLFYTDDMKKNASLISFSELNHAHISKFFCQPENQTMFYGNALFEVWLLFADNHSDTLFKRTDGTPLFLDGSHAFGYEDNFENLSHSFDKSNSFPVSGNLEGILRNKNFFKEWFIKIDSIEESILISVLDSIPERLLFSAEKEALLTFLTIERKKFIKIWTYRIQNNLL